MEHKTPAVAGLSIHCSVESPFLHEIECWPGAASFMEMRENFGENFWVGELNVEHQSNHNCSGSLNQAMHLLSNYLLKTTCKRAMISFYLYSITSSELLITLAAQS